MVQTGGNAQTAVSVTSTSKKEISICVLTVSTLLLPMVSVQSINYFFAKYNYLLYYSEEIDV